MQEQQNQQQKPQIFEEYPKVDCESCESFWTNQCDGVKPDTEKVCKAYVATRQVVLPQQIDDLKHDVHRLIRRENADRFAIWCILLALLVNSICELLGVLV